MTVCINTSTRSITPAYFMYTLWDKDAVVLRRKIPNLPFFEWRTYLLAKPIEGVIQVKHAASLADISRSSLRHCGHTPAGF